MKITAYLLAAAAIVAPLMRAQSAGAVYSQTNSPAGNSVVMLARSGDGSLGSPVFYPTGGLGTGAGLQSQGSVTLSSDGQWLLAVNAGSNEVSLFSVASGGSLNLRAHVPSGGTRPISVAAHGDTAFVLNTGASPNIAGFRLTQDGSLVPLANGAAAIQGTGPAQVSFDDHGELLVVTDRTSRQIEVFHFDGDSVNFLYAMPSAGQTPFGFAFAHNDVLVVSEAGSGSASSYKLSDQALATISPAVSNTQRAACWVAVTNNGKLAYVANAQTRSVSSYAVAPNGALTLIEAVAGSTPVGTAPTDVVLSRNSSYLYQLATGTISIFRVSQDGTLTNLGVAGGMPTTMAGMAAR
jgi:6-phosphogluconolactonase (cycloisomerase 2 family)